MAKQINTEFDVIVIGGGPSGMIAAGRAGGRGLSVLLLEKNKSLGRKLVITGGGRCNITNAEFDIHKLLSNYGSSKQLLYSSFSEFGVIETHSFFQSLGLPLVTQARNRVFPNTEKAEDVLSALVLYMKNNNVLVKTGVSVNKLERNANGMFTVTSQKTTYVARAVVVATGGLSHSETGSTGDGFKWLSYLGHKIYPPTPSIVPVVVEDEWIKSLSGHSFEFAKITFYLDGVKVFSKSGPILCTHYGLSGPTILNSSKRVGDMLHEALVTASINCFPDWSVGELEKYMIQIFDNNKNKSLKNVFAEIAPKGMSKVLLSLLPALDPEQKTHSVTKEIRKEISKLLNALPVRITGLKGFDNAVIADGGVSLDEVDMRTMQSKLVPNLYLTGDILHIERPSGGFSLQLCWTTGFVAGSKVDPK
ncbi:MAG: hypothetical protein A2566_00850 [Candidatus Zambryskibacteria bacterium RIFOXYD1_FULL_40_13]|nr:MAG: Flavoprotein, HI0933 family [Parcubacteria group bacterium GW2011_GWC1_39_12]KKR19683.1 MAG: Flavoprotein, HI0933 family [Parcubacteria group bacterium GW2011_GWF1_39_37]KKR35839.1 MAG: Flavoprotein, HI0933 family [Parcubacteria group bacterium GW2011_GWC2_40_10]KKR52651.1 MAG: Flavoprotein, HI0933 family [Parcubacteria group bacterium GW2011_GWE1_40_20]KKR65670.1 MAG: Flavoprotein, HI0933 family [Parcubacteria group bacterium GW2011_GWB1_40_5]KKR69170.1 MAG: Flavoprotein, HI0933 famil